MGIKEHSGRSEFRKSDVDTRVSVVRISDNTECVGGGSHDDDS